MQVMSREDIRRNTVRSFVVFYIPSLLIFHSRSISDTYVFIYMRIYLITNMYYAHHAPGDTFRAHRVHQLTIILLNNPNVRSLISPIPISLVGP